MDRRSHTRVAEEGTIATRDPRTIITPESFSVAPELIGRPLAAPWRRAAAMGVDLLLLALLVNAGGVALGLLGGAALFRIAARPTGGIVKRGLRIAVGSVGALVLFVTIVAVWDSATAGWRKLTGGGAGEPAAPGPAATVAEVVAFRRADTPEEARVAAERAAERLREAGVPDEEIGEALLEIAETGMPAWAESAVRSALEGAAEPSAAAEPTQLDSILSAYAAALRSGDTAAVSALGPRVVAAVAGDSLGRLARQIDALRAERRRLRAELEEVREEPSVLRAATGFADDLGLGLGWAGLYFTVSLTLWRGRTPGKRLFGIRVLQLDGRPVTWWTAFGRFGGYAASLATGLVGFLQILWDRNRQGLHDKIAETVVVRG